MLKRILFLLISIIFMILLVVGCSNNSNKNDNSTTLAASNIETGQVTQVNAQITNAEDKITSTALEEINKEVENKSTTIEITDENNSKVVTAEIKSENANKENKKKVIVIDPGHGGKSSSEKEPNSPGSTIMKAKNVSGATGISTKTPEHVIALKVSEKLKEQLISAGYTVIMTRTSASETISNIERAEIGNSNNADLVIRIHADSSTDSSVKGASMLIPGDVGYAKNIAKVSKKYGELIFNNVLAEAGMKNRGIITRTDLTGFNWSKVPVVLIEMGFLSNPEEDKLLSSESYQKKIAVGIFKGIEKALAE